MIYTVTFNPALDYVVRLERFQPGAVNRTSGEEIQFGGKGINVSTVLHNLGVESVALGFVAGFTGQALEQGLARAGVSTDFVHLERGLTRINVKIKGEEETEVNGRGPAPTPRELEALLEKLDALTAGDILVLAGSVSAGVPQDIYRQILRRLEGRGVLAAVDATGRLLEEVLPYRPFLVKPNRAELGELFGRALEEEADLRDCAAKLQGRGARNVLVSLAGDGSLLLDETGACHRLGAPRGAVKNSVGAGDSMVAGFLAGWLQSGSYAAAHRMGAAAGSATAFSHTLATKEEVHALLHGF